MSSFVQVDFVVLLYMVAGVFGLVGFFRGWWKEAITAGLLSALVILLQRPEAAGTVINSLNTLVTNIWSNVILPVTQGSGAIASQVDAGPILSEQNHSTYVVILIVFILASYFVGKIGLTDRVTAGGRVLGGVLGFYNGFVIITLVRDMLLGDLFPGAADMLASSTAAQPETLAIQLNNVPQTSVIGGPWSLAFIAAGLVLLTLALTTGFRTENHMLARRTPPMYGAGTKKK